MAVTDDPLRLAAVAFKDTVYSTADGGDTWTPATGVPVGGSWTNVAYSLAGSTIVATESPGFAYKSADGGATWSALVVY